MRTDWGGLVRFGVIVGVAVIICVCGVAGLASVGNIGDEFLNDQGNAHTERMRELETERERQKVLNAEALARVAEANVETERALAVQELAKQRTAEAGVEWQRAAGEHEVRKAEAYNTKRMADAAYHAIQRQGRLLTLSIAQQYFFGGVMGVALLLVVVLALVALNARKEKGAHGIHCSIQETNHESR